eukprot:1628195-Pleurochrysis_carterae.AAC.1
MSTQVQRVPTRESVCAHFEREVRGLSGSSPCTLRRSGRGDVSKVIAGVRPRCPARERLARAVCVVAARPRCASSV